MHTYKPTSFTNRELKMLTIWLCFWTLLFVSNATVIEDQANITDLLREDPAKQLSRRKRFITFPLGSSVSVALCMTIGMYGNPNYQWISYAFNWGIAYNLPNETISLQKIVDYNANKVVMKRELPRPVLQRSNRLELYSKLETIMDNMGYNGKSCIKRALCESFSRFGKKGSNMVSELLRTLFSLPKTKLLPSESKELLDYDQAHRNGRKKEHCPSLYPQCHFSLIELALGKFSKSVQFM